MACRLAVVPADVTDLQRALWRGLGMFLALLTLASLGILLSRTLEMNGGDWTSALHDLSIVLKRTHFGHAWAWRVPALATVWIAWAWIPRHTGRAWMNWLLAIALGVIMLTRSSTGHAADHGDFTLAVWLDWVHLLAAGAWVGSLFGMSLVVFPWLREAGDPVVTSARVFQRLSTLSGVALAALLVAGIWNATHLLGAFDALWTSRFGLVLLVKVAIVSAMIVLGAHNRYVKLPRLLATSTHTRGVVRACARAVLLESILGIAALGAAATLIHAMPPADMPHLQTTAEHAASTPAIGRIVATPLHR